MQQPPRHPQVKDRLSAWEWVRAGFWLAFGLTAGSIAVSIVILGILLGLGVITAGNLRV